MRRICAMGLCAIMLMLFLVSPSYGVPDVSGVRITDVTTASFSVVWMTDIASDPGVEVYLDNSMVNRITDSLVITPMPTSNVDVAQAARNKGLMKVRVSGLTAGTTYYVKAVSKDATDPASVAYSPLSAVTAASKVMPYSYSGNVAQGYSNDLADFKVYARPSDTGITPGMGDLIILESSNFPYPISALVGDGVEAPDGILDLNNVFDANGLSLPVAGGETIIVTVYRGEMLSTLRHYRVVPLNNNMVFVVEPAKGFFADINLDGKVDGLDFDEFRKQYRTLPDDANYNPDFNFVEDPNEKVDAREFSKFSREYGRTDVK